ncbi:alpha/beta fold hydrolase [Bacillus smithii]|uniref:alpha/beta fold hydrolase n=1 Tax=Bacillus smithii TaxID=1479 RepID=UPI00065E5D4C|nr:alpha/beta hydrolase [Bacillus smithii]AKP48254.1 2-hydroxy-6-oxonona-2,4-dienedioate hydrolase [Bacillus smithii]MED4882400.1 alpha/beta hydrolase [Bacillus smithii]MED4927554.1 alpha/beta hydrolase [Bacillus smithii]
MFNQKERVSIKIDDSCLYYRYIPNSAAKYTLVFLHGFLSSSFSFRKLIPLLKTDYALLLIDWPPFGKSKKSKAFLYSYENIAASILRLLRSFQFESVVLVGHSMGGQLILNMLKQKPDAAEKMILINGSAYIPRFKQSLILASYLPFAHRLVKRLLEKTGVEGNLRSAVYEHEKIDQEMVAGYMEPFLSEDIFHELIRFLRHREGDLSSVEIQNIQTPSLLIHGEFDKIVPFHIGKRLAQDLPNSRLVMIEKAGHLLPEENPEEICRHLNEFVSVEKGDRTKNFL